MMKTVSLKHRNSKDNPGELAMKVQFSLSVMSDSCDPMDCSMLGLQAHYKKAIFTV